MMQPVPLMDYEVKIPPFAVGYLLTHLHEQDRARAEEMAEADADLPSPPVDESESVEEIISESERDRV